MPIEQPTSPAAPPDAFGDAEIVAASSTINASEYPITGAIVLDDGLTINDGQPAAYDHWQCLNQYNDGPGTIILPTANPTGTNIQVDYTSKMMTLTQRWTARRSGAPPELPPKYIRLWSDPTQTDTNWVFVGGEGPQTRELGVAADSVSIIYEASGVYIFQALDASKVCPVSEIPPALNRNALLGASLWVTQASPEVTTQTLLAENEITATSPPGTFGGGTGTGTNPLGNGGYGFP